MQGNSRTNMVVKNIAIGLSGQMLMKILAFVSRTIFIQMLGVVYLGVNGLFTNILSILSLAELGIGTAIVYSLYEPLAKKNESLVESLVALYAKAYFIIGSIIFVLGLMVAPFLDLFIRDQPNIQDLTLIYLLYLISTTSSYFFAYKRALFTADQKNYVNLIYDNIFGVITVFIQMGVLLTTGNFVLYLVIKIVFTLIANIMISFKADKAYPYIKNKTKMPIPKIKVREIKKNVYSMFMMSIGTVVVNGTDNLVISSFIGLVWVGLYSNYIMIVAVLEALITQIFNPITASVGNLVSLESKEKSLEVFNKINYLNFVIYSVVCINLFIFLNPFISLWIGQEYILSTPIVLVFVLNIYLMGMRRTLSVYTRALGLFYHFRYIAFMDAGINLVVSLLLVTRLGIIGVLLGTTTATILTYLFYEPHILFKHYFKETILIYIRKYCYYFLITALSGFLLYNVTLQLGISNWIELFLNLIVANIFIAFLLVVFSIKAAEFNYFRAMIFRILGSKYSLRKL